MTIELVIIFVAVKNVRSQSPGDVVIAGSTFQDVITRTAINHVITIISKNLIITLSAPKVVATGTTADLGDNIALNQSQIDVITTGTTISNYLCDPGEDLRAIIRYTKIRGPDFNFSIPIRTSFNSLIPITCITLNPS